MDLSIYFQLMHYRLLIIEVEIKLKSESADHNDRKGKHNCR